MQVFLVFFELILILFTFHYFVSKKFFENFTLFLKNYRFEAKGIFHPRMLSWSSVLDKVMSFKDKGQILKYLSMSKIEISD